MRAASGRVALLSMLSLVVLAAVGMEPRSRSTAQESPWAPRATATTAPTATLSSTTTPTSTARPLSPTATRTPAPQVPPLIPREVLFGNPKYARLRISPDGTRIAYLAPDANDVLQVWARTIGQGDDWAVTSDPRRGVQSYFWSYASQQILYLQDSDGDENFHIFSIDVAGGGAWERRNIGRVRSTLVAARSAG